MYRIRVRSARLFKKTMKLGLFGPLALVVFTVLAALMAGGPTVPMPCSGSLDGQPGPIYSGRVGCGLAAIEAGQPAPHRRPG